VGQALPPAFPVEQATQPPTAAGFLLK